jgi:hypothetical protein
MQLLILSLQSVVVALPHAAAQNHAYHRCDDLGPLEAVNQIQPWRAFPMAAPNPDPRDRRSIGAVSNDAFVASRRVAFIKNDPEKSGYAASQPVAGGPV